MNRNKYKNPVRQKKLEEEDRILLHFGTEVYLDRYSKGRWFLHEHPWDADSWSDECIQEVASLPGVYVVRGDMCPWGLESKADDGRTEAHLLHSPLHTLISEPHLLGLILIWLRTKP